MAALETEDPAYTEYLRKIQELRGYDPRLDTDYSWRDAFKEGYIPQPGHGTDRYKLPNHPTFSDQSMYHGVDGNEGGKWEQNQAGIWSFTPGKTNLQNWSVSDLQKYFEQREPDVTLILPKGEK